MARLTSFEIQKLVVDPEGFKDLTEEQKKDEKLVHHALSNVPGIFPFLDLFFRDNEGVVLDFMLDTMGGRQNSGGRYYESVSSRLRGDIDFIERMLNVKPSMADVVLPNIPKEKLVNKYDVIQLALISKGEVYQYLVGDLVCDLDVLRVCLTCRPEMLRYAPFEVQRSRFWILHCVRLNAESIRNLEGRSKVLPAVRPLLEDLNFAQELVDANPNVYRYLVGRPRKNSSIIRSAIEGNGQLYTCLPDSEQKSGKWEGTAFRSGLDWLPEILSDRDEFIDDFLSVHPNCVEGIPEEHVRAKEWIRMCHQSTQGRCWFGKGEQEIFGDTEFVLDLLRDTVGFLWEVLPQGLRTNSGFVLRAVEVNPEVYPWLGKNFQAQKKVFAALGLNRGAFLQFSPQKLLNDNSLLREVAVEFPSCLQYLEVDARQMIVDSADAEFVQESIRKYGNNLAYFWGRLDALKLDENQMLRLALEEGGGDWLPEDCVDVAQAKKAISNWSSRTRETARLRYGKRHITGPPIVNWYHHGILGSMTTFRDRFCQDKGFVLFLIHQVVNAWEQRGGGKKDSRRFGLFRFNEPQSWFTENGLLSLWREDAEVVSLAIGHAPECMKGVCVNLLRQLDFAVPLIQRDLTLFKTFPDSLLKDLTWVRSVIARLGGDVLTYDFKEYVFLIDPTQELKGVLTFGNR